MPKQPQQQNQPTGYGYDYISRPAGDTPLPDKPSPRKRMSPLERFLRYGIVGLINRDATPPDLRSRLRSLMRLLGISSAI